MAAMNNIHNALLQNWADYKLLVGKVKDHLNLLPSSSAIEGLYTMMDNTHGVWKAPDNVSINLVHSPSEITDNAAQENLDTDWVL